MSTLGWFGHVLRRTENVPKEALTWHLEGGKKRRELHTKGMSVVLYTPVMCKHNKHLGYYRMDTTKQKEVDVTPLSEARNVEVGASFWTGKVQNRKLDEENKTTKKNRGIMKERTITKVDANSPQIIRGRWNVLRNMRLPYGKNKNSSTTETIEAQSAKTTGNLTENYDIGEDHVSVDLQNIKSYWLDDDDSDHDLNIFT